MASSSLSASSASAGRCGGSGVAALRPLRTRGARSAKISRETARPPASVLSCPLPQRRRPRDSDDAYSPGRGAAAAADQHLPLAESDMEKLRRSRFTPFATVFRPRRCPPAAAPEARVDVKYSHPRDAATAEAFIAEPLVVHYRSYTGCQELHHVSSGTTALHSRNSSSSHSSSMGRSSSSSRSSSSRRRKVLLGSTISSITVAHSIWTRPVRAADASDWTSPGLAKPTSNARYFKLPSGTVYEEIAEGSGERAAPGDTISYHYVLRRSNGYFVYSTQDAYVGDNDADGEPEFATLGDGSMIQGLEELFVGMQAGEKRRALVPPAAGYVEASLAPQPQGFGPRRQIAAHGSEPLLFEVELLRVNGAR